MIRKKIIVVNNLLGYYGAENVLINMVNHLDQQRYDVTVLTLIESEHDRIVSGIKYKYIFRGKSSFLTKIENKLKLTMGFECLAKMYCNGYDIAIAFKMGESAKLVGYCDAPKKLCWIHSNVSEIEEACSYSFKSLMEEQDFLSRFSTLVAVSKVCAESFLIKYQGDFNLKIVYNPIDVEKILADANETLSITEKELFNGNVPVLGTVARIDAQKRIDRLIHISERLLEEKIDHKFVIIGDGVDYKKFSDEIKQKHLDNIAFIGFQSNPYKFMKRFNLFICSSQWESYSIVVNEALALGVPVISTKCDGPEEVLQYGKYGILTENNEDALYFAIRKFLIEGMPKKTEYNAIASMKNFLEKIDELFGE